MKRLMFLLLVGGLSITFGPARADIIRVPLDAPTIQAGINAATAGDVVEVACGTYTEHDIRMRSGVTLRSESGDPACVTIDAQQQGQVLYFRSLPSTTRVEGLTITGGYATRVYGEGGEGGGVYCIDAARPVFEDCIIIDNYAEFDGGGVFCGYSSFPTFINCQIDENEAANGGSGVRCTDNATPTFQGGSISRNIGTGLWSGNGSNPKLIGCTIMTNDEEGVLATLDGAATLEDCTIAGNLEGGLWARRSSVSLTGCEISGNQRNTGAGIYLMDGEVTLTDCVVKNNVAGSGGAFYLEMWLNPGAKLTATNTIFEGNTATNDGPLGFVESGTQASLKCSVEDPSGIGGAGTVSLDNNDCSTAVEAISWTRLKRTYR